MSHQIKRLISVFLLMLVFISFILRGFQEHFLFYANLGAICILSIAWNQYDHKEPRLGEIVLCSCMIAIAVAGRVLFLWAPAFKPVTALVMISGVALGRWNGFLSGSLAALLSDIFFGQGPWTFFQMLAWGIIGYACGIPFVTKQFDKRPMRILFSISSGIFFSVFMDIYTIMSTGSFEFLRYFALLLTSLPFMLTYIISNIVFLEFLYPVFIKKMKRIKLKYDM